MEADSMQKPQKLMVDNSWIYSSPGRSWRTPSCSHQARVTSLD